MSKLQVLFYVCIKLHAVGILLPLNLTSFVLNVSKVCTLCLLALTLSNLFVKYGHVSCT
ncbi:hypothetical protein Hanom_Chr17g01590981 [Helianthus anomalus]